MTSVPQGMRDLLVHVTIESMINFIPIVYRDRDSNWRKYDAEWHSRKIISSLHLTSLKHDKPNDYKTTVATHIHTLTT